MAAKQEAEKIDLEKPRRNLLIISCVLIFIQVAGIEVRGLNVPGLSIEIHRPKLIVLFLWLIYLYSFWRFWVLSRSQHESLQKISNKLLSQCSYVQAAIGAKGWKNVDSLKIVRSPFTRKVEFLTQDEIGDHTVPQSVQLQYKRMLGPELTADLRSLLLEKASVEYWLPIMVACFPPVFAALSSVQAFT